MPVGRNPIGKESDITVVLPMTKYLYIVSVKKTFVESELNLVKVEICNLFDCTDIEVSGSTKFLVYTSLRPEETEQALRQLSGKFGGEFRGGVKME